MADIIAAEHGDGEAAMGRFLNTPICELIDQDVETLRCCMRSVTRFGSKMQALRNILIEARQEAVERNANAVG